ncbi:hypothetical protein EJ05DRAFT_502342 [Pseudovirgaria hyperparasitica]|uniref:Thioesterase/thiol ester dehydrase-isomerase n=1 Tax=Pseudovirgaria hyperparasitica TaxID=470096 RepID=A0A6A6W196_9PEZI|nr:uncharacterized protein EJ05DRAFT_502342 [Pseudovirgaria hyperparasitica]KAF2755866.1 hypothetical protein EJ05DRAFT_502342 [Pseudovirgaria hyperparasitica]
MASTSLSRRLPTSLLRNSLSLFTRRFTSDLSHLNAELCARKIPLIYDSLAPDNSHKLQIALSACLPSHWTNTTAFPPPLPPADADADADAPPAGAAAELLPPAHHLVYFNPAIPADRLLADGTDPLQSPGPPFVRRMWAGGYLNFGKGGPRLRFAGCSGHHAQPPGVCLEGIRDVRVKGKDGEEKVFVGIERRFGSGRRRVPGEGEDEIRQRLWRETEEDLGEAELVERRNIVFMRERSPEEARKASETKTTKILRAQHAPDFSYAFTPTPALLFRYSALTFNAHRIHLDPQYCREVEGHRDLLFHGPLSLTLLMTQLEAQLQGTGKAIEFFEYRNLAPLYCNEEVKVCGKDLGDGKYELWAENAEGALSVKGTARAGNKQ